MSEIFVVGRWRTIGDSSAAYVACADSHVFSREYLLQPSAEVTLVGLHYNSCDPGELYAISPAGMGIASNVR